MHTIIAGFRKQSFLALMLAFATVAQIGAPVIAYATANNNDNQQKINICHRTDSSSNPWEAIRINLSSWNNGTGPGKHSIAEGDFVYTGPINSQNQQPLKPEGDAWCADWAPEPEQPVEHAATVKATKIVCPNESDLPNWGAGGPDITETTAADFLKKNPQCKTVQNWQFEWGPNNAADPGAAFTGPAGGVWKPFTTATDANGVATAYVPLNKEASRFWFREVLQPGYIPFTYPANNPVSAEMYCNNDVLNYDNYDWIDMPAAPKKDARSALPTYHCVAFNVKKPVENTCSIPNTLGSTQPFELGISPETPLATIFANNSISLDPVLDQKNFQKWDVASGTISVSMDVELLAKYAGNNQVFGYYLNSNPASFVPVFRVGTPANPAYASLPEASVGSTYPVTITGLTGTPSFGFAIATDPSAPNTYFTEVLMNPGETPRDHAAVYNPAPNTYIIAFEDQPILTSGGADRDFNDVVVRVKNVRCTACENQNGMVVSDAFTTVTSIATLDAETAMNASSTLVDLAANPTTNAWNADDAPVDFGAAKWIWSEDPVTGWAADKTVTFERTFNVTGPATNAVLMIAADNSYTAYVNGVKVGENLTEQGYAAPAGNYAVTNLVPGQNTLKVVAKNWGLPSGNPVNNPAGVIFKLTWAVQCGGGPVDPGTAKVFIRKNVDGIAAAFTGSTTPSFPFTLGAGSLGVNDSLSAANNYSYTTVAIPKYGSPVTVTETTGTSPESIVLPKDAQCAPGKYRLVGYTTGTSFEDAQAKASDPANIVTGANINIGTLSADAYVIIWNEDCKLSTVTACKYEQTEDSKTGIPLSGWTLALLGAQVEDNLAVNTATVAGAMSSSLTAGTSYVANAVGSWMNQGGNNPADAEYSQVNATGPWVDMYPGFVSDVLELRIDNQFGTWGAYNSAHSYWRQFTPAATGPVNFGIFDGENGSQNASWFGDNSGTITVDIYKGYAGTTGENGCVTWQNVPYGTYTLDEQLQDGWRKVSGTGTVVVDGLTENFSVVNARIVDECEGRECDGGPSGPTTGTIAVDFVINGGTLDAATLSATVGSESITEASSLTNKAIGPYTFVAGAQSGYTGPVYSGDCDATGVLTVVAGMTKTCVITYTAETTTPGGPTITSTDGGSRSGGNSRNRGSVLGASTSIPEGEVLGASTELPGLPNTGTAPLNSGSEAVTLLAMIVALAGVNLVALRSERKEA